MIMYVLFIMYDESMYYYRFIQFFSTGNLYIYSIIFKNCSSPESGLNNNVIPIVCFFLVESL